MQCKLTMRSQVYILIYWTGEAFTLSIRVW